MSQYGRSPYDITSHISTPKLQMSLAELNLRCWKASGAVQRTGTLLPCGGGVRDGCEVIWQRISDSHHIGQFSVVIRMEDPYGLIV